MRLTTVLAVSLVLATFVAGPTHAQTVLQDAHWRVNPGAAAFGAPAWRVTAGTPDWFKADNNTRGGDYNAATDHVVVISRTGGLNGIILDAANGSQLGTLNMTGVTGGTFALSEVAITGDGQIFGANLTVNSTNSPAKIYRWATEAAEPVLVYSGDLVAGKRFGDGVGIEGSGNDVTFYVGGSGNDAIAKLKWDGTAMTYSGPLVPQTGIARGRYGIAPIPGTGQAWINSPGLDFPLTLIDTATGAIVAEVDDAVVSRGNGDLDFFKIGSRSYVATGPNFTGFMEYTIVDVTDPAHPKRVALSEQFTTNPNGNATGFVAYDTKRGNVIVGASNNAIVSSPVDWFRTDNNTRGGGYNPATGHVVVISRSGGLKGLLLDGATGVQVGNLDVTGIAGGTFPLNEIAITEDGQIFGANLVVSASATSVAKIYRWADETSAPELIFEGPVVLGKRWGDGVGIKGSGTNVTFYLAGSGNNENVAEFVWDGASLRLENIVAPEAGQHRARYGVAPVPGTATAWVNSPTHPLTLISTTDGSILAAVPEDKLSFGFGDLTFFVREGRRYVATGPNFAGFGEFAVVDVSNPQAVEVVAVTENFAANPNGNATGFAAYDADHDRLIVMTTNNGMAAYSLASLPVSNEPAAFGAENWRITAGGAAWFATDNALRGGDYNPKTDHLVVISRTGSLKGIVLDAASGAEVGMLDVTGIAGGTFPLSEIAITEDGQIFGANLTVSASEASPSRIYRWAHEGAVPELVFVGPIAAGKRFGDGIGVEGLGDNVHFYVSGSGNDIVAQLHWNGSSMTVARQIVAEAGVPRGRYGIAPIPYTGLAWINSPTHDLALIATNGASELTNFRCIRLLTRHCSFDLNPAPLQASVPNTVASAGAGDLDYFEYNGRAYVATGPNFTGFMEFMIIDVTDPYQASVVSMSPKFDANPNGNATGFVTFDSKRKALIVGASNNAIVSFSMVGGSPGSAVGVEEESSVPTAFTLRGNYPNPFNPTTNVVFDLNETANVAVSVFDMLGREVMAIQAMPFASGTNQQIAVDASALRSGSYVYRVTADGMSGRHVQTGTMVVLK